MFRLTKVIPERTIFVTRGITVFYSLLIFVLQILFLLDLWYWDYSYNILSIYLSSVNHILSILYLGVLEYNYLYLGAHDLIHNFLHLPSYQHCVNVPCFYVK